MNKTLPGLLLCTTLLSISPAVFAQEGSALPDSTTMQNMSLEELMKLQSTGISSEMEKIINDKLSVGSKKPLSSRKSPSIVSVITEEEIRKSGARDLIDVLRQVPGFDFGSDVQGSIGLGVRGNWASEGKVLFLLDGQEMNEIMYGTIYFGNNINLSQVKKIEIIRGPGSTIYGGYAEYGVINVITKSGEETNGVKIYGMYGQMEKTYARRNIAVAIGKKIGGADINLTGFFGQGNRSDRDYTDIYGGTYNMAGNANLNPGNINFGFSYKGLSVRLIYDKLDASSRDGYGGAGLSKMYGMYFESYLAEVKYDWKLAKNFTITPKFNFKRQIPWKMTGVLGATEVENESYDNYDRTADRYRFSLNSTWDISQKVNLVSGGEVFVDHAVDNWGTGIYTADGSLAYSVKYVNIAPYAQALIKSKIANITLGARYDYNSSFNGAFVPRVGLTKKVGKFNFKALYGKSFRAPAIENVSNNINLNGAKMNAEKSTVIEFETGYQLGRDSYITCSLFDITTSNIIVYTPLDTTASRVLGKDLTEGYRNEASSGSQGVEIEFRTKQEWGYFNAGYSFYTTGNKGKVAEYIVPGQSNLSLGFPAHKINFNASFNVYKGFSINPSAIFYSKRYGYALADETGAPILKQFDNVLLFNLFLNYDDAWVKGLNIGLGCYDVFGQNYQYVQPYNTGVSTSDAGSVHAPLPGTSREITLRLTYSLNFKNQ